MLKLFALASIFIASSAMAKSPENPIKAHDCEMFSAAAFQDQPTAIRVKATVIAISSSYGLSYSESDLAKLTAKLKKKIDNNLMSLDGLERVALLGCSDDMSTDDGDHVKKQLDSILNEK